MSFRTRSLLIASVLASSVVAGSVASDVSAETEPFTFGMILVGPRDDHGWSQAHFEGGEYVAEQLGAEMIVVDSVNPADKPETSVEQVVGDMVDQGAQLIFATSDDMRDGILAAAEAHPDVPMIWSSGDSAWPEGANYRDDLSNLGNIMGQMEYGKALAGCAAAMESQTGHLSYLGPLVNDETRRLVNSAFLGARHCWTEMRGEEAAALIFDVTFIGFWFNIPGVTLDPTQVTNSFFDGGADVVLSGIDTTEALVVARQQAANGEDVLAVPYDFVGACAEAEEVCLGVPYFNWGPSYLETAQAVIDDEFEATWQWLPPNWEDINDAESSAIGFVAGEALSEEGAAAVDEYTQVLADGGFGALFVGPLNFQDGSQFLADGETATESEVWYMPDLLEGMSGEAEVPE
jgi:simple sugar transport system substrate-binding protein